MVIVKVANRKTDKPGERQTKDISIYRQTDRPTHAQTDGHSGRQTWVNMRQKRLAKRHTCQHTFVYTID